MKFTIHSRALILAIAGFGCSPIKRVNMTFDPNMENQIENIQNFSLETEDLAYAVPDDYLSRFDGKFSDIGDRTPVNDFVPSIDDDIAEPDIDFLDDLDPEQSMAMFGDTDESKRIFYIKSETATVYRQRNGERQPVKVLKKGQRIKASLENGWAKIGSRFYMALDELSLTPVPAIRAAKRIER